MCENSMQLTVFFEDPFWVGVLERSGAGVYEVCKVTFGAEPRDAEVYAFLLENVGRLSFSPALREQPAASGAVHSKRARREAQKLMERRGVGTRAQQALRLQREQNRQERRERSRRQKKEEENRLFALRRKKRREKHQGH